LRHHLRRHVRRLCAAQGPVQDPGVLAGALAQLRGRRARDPACGDRAPALGRTSRGPARRGLAATLWGSRRDPRAPYRGRAVGGRDRRGRLRGGHGRAGAASGADRRVEAPPGRARAESDAACIRARAPLSDQQRMSGLTEGRGMARKKRRKQAAGRARTPLQARSRQGAPPRPRPDGWVLAVAGVGLLVTGYLTLAAWGDGTPVLCAQGGGCDLIRNSRWSTLAGLPLAPWGFGLYALIALAAATGATAAARWRRLSRLTLLGLAVSVYLTIVGVVELEAACGWCLVSLATMAALFGLVHLRRPGAPLGQRSWGSWWLANGL